MHPEVRLPPGSIPAVPPSRTRATAFQALAVGSLTILASLTGCGGGGTSAGGAPTVIAAGGASSITGAGGAPPVPAVAGASPTAGEAQATVIVGNSADATPGATRYAQLTDVPWSSLAPGTAVRVAPGTYGGVVTIVAQGSAGAPITVGAADPSNPPVVTNSIDFQRSAWIQVANLVVQSPSYAGFIVRQASHHISIADSTITGAPIGILIGDAAGTAISLLRNRIVDAAGDGIGVDGVNADPSDPSIIQDNVVTGSGHHGMEIRGSNYRIERNDVSTSGRLIGGTSGIHLYSAAEGDGTCQNNLVRYNLSHANADTSASDGNGLQADRFCDRNVFAFNVAWDNDGAGIALYDANDNQVYANTLVGNGRDPGATHGSLGQIVLNSSQVGGPRPSGNSIYDNIAVSSRSAVPALYVDTNAVDIGSNRPAPNLLWNSAGGTVLRWTDSQFLTTLADIDAATGNASNLSTLPAFADASHPETDGLRLTVSPGSGSVDLAGQVDRLGATGVAGQNFFGAYFGP